MSWSLTASLLTFRRDRAGSASAADERLVQEVLRLEQAVSAQRMQVPDYERRIAMLIRPGQIHYSSHFQRLYFVEARDQPLRSALREILEGMGLKFEPRPISSDEHGIFTNGFMLPVPESAHRTVAVALRLMGATVF